ncbi:urea amidolyase associated protein UAAP1 [Cellulomonas sp.]|uniref:urea amidolyase associated protein UAAP1 n=1 Tax=Cellulomonas sp. TaxID=40001 RepID=UPI002D2F5834|nr:urea amidolyase associated protein UAAP1 [Cellulomonas sp.]HYQ75605.1 urea amidolyase associated protein UAAP1 [Cellulomonas sp.]
MTSISTASPLGARDHARAQGGTVVDTMPTVPAATAADWPADVAPGDRLHAETVAGGNYTTVVLARGSVLELTDLAGDACAHLVLTNAAQVDERLNVADTVKIQWQAYLGAGSMLLSDRGRVLATVVEDTSGRHDTFAGTSSRAANEARYGDGSPQGGTPAGRELLLLAALKNGLDARDVPPSLSFFQGVRVADDGTTEFTGSAGPGARVRLRLELPCVVLLANVPHPVDPRAEYVSTPLRVRAWRGTPAALDAPEATVGPEAARAFANTIDYARARGL